MGLFSFKKKKEAKQESLDLPPPPAPEEQLIPMPEAPGADVQIIDEPQPMEELEPMPELPAMPETPQEMSAMSSGPRVEPLFVSVEDYQEVLGSITYIRNKLEDAEELVKKLNALKTTEEKEFELWRNQLEDMQRKLAYVEDVIFAAG